MRSIVIRLAMAFGCVVVFLLGQNLVASRTEHYIHQVESEARSTERRLDRLQLELARVRLTVYKLIATLRPSEMDQLKRSYSEAAQPLLNDLLAEGLPRTLVVNNFVLYGRAIALHYDFAVKTARRLVSGPSKKVHETLMGHLRAVAKEKFTEERGKVAAARKTATRINAALLVAALFTALFWAVLLARNLTDRSKAQRELNASRERLSLALAGADLVPWDWDLASGYVALPQQWAQARGVGRDGRVHYHEMMDLVHPEDRKKVESGFDRHFAGKTPHYEMELRLTGPDGEWTWMLSRGRVVERDPKGFPLRAAGTFLDISLRKRMEKVLESSRQRLALAVGALDAAVWEISLPPADDSYFNRRTGEICGCGPEEMPSGRELLNWLASRLHPEDENEIRRAFREFALGRSLRLDKNFRVRHQDGHWVWVHSVNEAVERDAAGRASRIIGLAIDITENIQAEKARADLEMQLHQAQKMEAVGTLAGGIAHDFNNLLGAVMGYAELAMDARREGAADRGELDAIVRAAERGRTLVRQILTFSRKNEAELSPVDLNRVADLVADLLQHTLPKMIQLELDKEASLPLANADPTQVEQVLLNLATNAADAMPDGGKLLIRTRARVLDEEYCRKQVEVRPGDYVCLEVNDNGLGMDENTLEQIFDPFFTTKGPGKGTGLGLSSVYGIVKSHGGHIEVQSRPGQGASFSVFLPVAARARQAKPSEIRPDRRPTGEGQTILLVDDEAPLREIGAQFLMKDGYRVLTAESGEQALEICREHWPVDLVVLDLSMPGMGGHRCLQALVNTYAGLGVVVASGYSRDATRSEVLAAGAVDFLSKPYNRAQLLAAVTKNLPDQPAGGNSSSSAE